VDVKVERGPVCEIAAPGGVPHIHASLWLRIDLEAWGERRAGHLHLVRPAGGGAWSQADVARHPMRPTARQDATVELEPVISELRAVIATLPLEFFRLPDLDAVSEFGEGREAFRRRVLGVLRPALQQAVDEAAGKAAVRRLRPWRRERAAEMRRRRQAELAGRLSSLAGAMETFTCRDPWSTVRRIEIGILRIPEGVDLTPTSPRDPMIRPAAAGRPEPL